MRGLKHTALLRRQQASQVAPYVGAWIETSISAFVRPIKWSHPTWVRGLKLHHRQPAHHRLIVAPYVGAWIETLQSRRRECKTSVAPYVGAWIETRLFVVA